MNENPSQTIQELSEDKEIKNSSELDNDALSQNEEELSLENKDIKSSQIGELILKNLRKENEVAYIRYASVYRKFYGVKDFISTLESLKGTSKNQLASIL